MQTGELLVETKKGGNGTLYNLMPFGDLQIGSPLFNRPMWDQYVEAVSKVVNPITIGMGDYTDNFRPTVQARLSGVTGPDKESQWTVDEMHRSHIMKDVLPRLKPVIEKSHCLGLLAGHHDMTYGDGTNSTQLLCKFLKVPYLGRGECMIRVNLKFHRRVLHFTVWASHGEGGGQSVGTPVLKLQKMLAHMDCDVALRGHSCDKFIFQEPQFYLDHTSPPRLRQRNRIIANTGGFSDSRVEGIDTYVERSNLIPKAMGWVEIHIHVKRDRDMSLTPKQRDNASAYVVIGD